MHEEYFRRSMASTMCGIVSIVNLISLILLCKPAVASLKDYEDQLELGFDPIFVPEDCIIDNATIWHKIAKENYKDQLGAYNKAHM